MTGKIVDHVFGSGDIYYIKATVGNWKMSDFGAPPVADRFSLKIAAVTKKYLQILITATCSDWSTK